MDSFNSMKDAKQQVTQLAGETFQVERPGHTTHAATGLRTTTYISFFPEDDVQVGDVLRSVATEEVFHVVETDEQIIDGEMLSVHAVYETDAQRIEQLEAAHAHEQSPFAGEPEYGFTPGSGEQDVRGGAVDLRQLELEIERQGGPDKEALHAMAASLNKALNGAEPPERGFLAPFSLLLERNGRLGGAIAAALLQWATTPASEQRAAP